MTARRMLAGALVLLTVCLGLPLERSPEAQPAGLIRAVGAVGMTVGNMERSTAFYSGALGFEKVSDVEVLGEDYERLQGIFGLRMHIVRMRLAEKPSSSRSTSRREDGRFRWTHGVTTVGFSTSRSS